MEQHEVLDQPSPADDPHLRPRGKAAKRHVDEVAAGIAPADVGRDWVADIGVSANWSRDKARPIRATFVLSCF